MSSPPFGSADGKPFNRLSTAPTETKASKELDIEVTVIEQLEQILKKIKYAAEAKGATSTVDDDSSLVPHTSHHSHLGEMRSRIGLEKEAPLDEDHVELSHHELIWSRVRYLFREPFAEFWG